MNTVANDPSTMCLVFDLHGVIFRMRYCATVKHLWRCPEKVALLKLAFNPRFLWCASECLYKRVVVEQHLKNLATNFVDFARVYPTALAMVNEQVPVPEMVSLLEGLHARGYTLAVFSNIGQESITILRSKYPAVFDFFQIIVHSSEQDDFVAKPSNEAFKKLHMAVSQLAVDRSAHALILIDNEPQNLHAAARHAILGFQFHSPRRLRRELIQRGFF